MKVYVDTIPAEGIELTERFAPHAISVDLEAQGITFTRDILVKARAMRTGKDVFVDIFIEAPVEYTCSRCLARYSNMLAKKFNISYEVTPGDILDVDDDIRQEIILESPIKLVCKPDCKGLCPTCGQNLNIAKCDCKS